MKTLDVERTPEFSSPDAYFQHYRLEHDENDENDENDEHWAERQFIERVFIPLCGLDGLRYLKPQVPFEDSRRIRRRIDFVLEGEKRYALEIEGQTHHDEAHLSNREEARQRFNREKTRQQELTKAGFEYFPMSWGHVRDGEAEPALRGLIEQDPLLRPLLEPTEALDLLHLAWLSVALPQRYPDAQRTALALLARASERGLTRLNKALKCQDCSKVFIQPKRVDKWETTLQQRHEDFKQDRFPLLVATKGFGMGIDKRNVSFVVHHAFASGLEGYYQEAGRSGRANQRAHVALLYIPPTEACIHDTLDQLEMPHCMTDPDAFRYRQCPRPYNLPVICDFSHQARFIQDSYLGVEADCETTYAVYQRLKAGQPLASQDDFNPPTPGDDGVNDAPSVDRKQTVYQLAIYRLQQLGIVRGYTIQYSGLTQWRFEVEFEAHWQPQTLLEQVRRFLERSRRPDADDVVESMQVLSELTVQCGFPPWTDEHRRPEIALLKKAISTLLRRVYSRVRTMRLQMLRDQLDYARAAENTCRRVTLLNLFNKDKVAVDKYKCRFCDVCVPDLNFQQDLATDAVGSIELEDLVKQLNDTLAAARPDLAELYKLIQQVQKYGVVLGMLARTTQHLEGDPDSLPALYLAGALSWQIPARQNQALGYFRAGFKEGRQQGLAQETLLELFYRAGAEIDAEEAVRWLNDFITRFTTPVGLLKWVQRWELLLGRDSSAYRALSSIARVRALHRLSGPLQELKSLATKLQTPRPERPHRHVRHPLP